MLHGPAALAPAAATQLGLTAVSTDPHTGYPQLDAEQYGHVQAAWETILTLMASIGMTTPAPPKTTLTINVPLATLLCLRAGILPGATGPHAPPGHRQDDPDRAQPAPEPHEDTEPDQPGASLPADPNDVNDANGAGLPQHGAGASGESDGADGSDADDDEFGVYDREDRAYIDGLGHIPYQALLYLLSGEPDLQRLVTDEVTGLPLDLGPVIKNPTARMRRRIQLRDQTCRFPYCTRPAISPRGQADLDHINPHRPDGTGGPTADTNLHTLCREHHRIRHHTTWHIQIHDGTATLTWRNPDLGLHIITRPGGHTDARTVTPQAPSE